MYDGLSSFTYHVSSLSQLHKEGIDEEMLTTSGRVSFNISPHSMPEFAWNAELIQFPEETLELKCSLAWGTNIEQGAPLVQDERES